MQPIPCPYRDAVRGRPAVESATCRLLQQLAGLPQASWCTVGRDACEACCASFPPSLEAPNPVVASLLFDLARRIANRGGVPACTPYQARTLQKWARAQLESTCDANEDETRSPGYLDPFLKQTQACDVVVCCADSAPQAEQAVQSVLAQRGAVPFVHLVDNGGGGQALVGRYRRRWKVA